MKYLYLRYPQGKAKAVTFSYDDGAKYDIRFSEIMNKNGIKGTFNLNGDYIIGEDDGWHMNINEVKENILDSGHEIAVHGSRHLAPGRVLTSMALNDCLKCRIDLEETFGIIINGMAYPDSGITEMTNGNTYEEIKGYLKSAGIVYARTLGGDNDKFDLPEDFLAWMPTAYHINSELFDMIKKFNDLNPDDTNKYKDPKLFYLWGHSYEFNRDNSWDRIEKACQELGNKSDVWYATNGEIYNYIKGYNSLVFSANGKTVYNPNCFEIWFNIDGETLSVKPGEMLNISLKNELF